MSNPETFSLSGRAAFVTGAAQGLGLAITTGTTLNVNGGSLMR